jgi:hypothetical protein
VDIKEICDRVRLSDSKGQLFSVLVEIQSLANEEVGKFQVKKKEVKA